MSGHGASADPACRCGHGRSAHEHYRRGSDCGACSCSSFRRVRVPGRLRAALRPRRTEDPAAGDPEEPRRPRLVG